jgi:hypothetical protein
LERVNEKILKLIPSSPVSPNFELLLLPTTVRGVDSQRYRSAVVGLTKSGELFLASSDPIEEQLTLMAPVLVSTLLIDSNDLKSSLPLMFAPDWERSFGKKLAGLMFARLSGEPESECVRSRKNERAWRQKW